MQGAAFDHLQFTEKGSLLLRNVNLGNTTWTGADTTKITFDDVNLFGSNITLDQLAKAKGLDVKTTLPEGIDFQAVQARRRELNLASAPSAGEQGARPVAPEA